MKSNYKNGSVIKTKNGKFRAFFMHNGKRISKTFAAKNKALDWLAINRSSVALGDWIEPTDITLGQWVAECLTSMKARLKPSTMEGYKCYAKKLLPLAHVKLQKISGIQIQKLLDGIPSASNRYDTFRFIRNIFGRALRLEVISKDVTRQVETPRYHRKEKDVFTKEEIARIRKALEHHRYKTFFTLAFATGCRLGELLGLRIGSVREDFIRIEETVRHSQPGTPKNESSYRDIPLPPYILKMLRDEWWNNSGILNGYIFTNRKDRIVPLATDTIVKNWHKILMHANVPYRNFHNIRHTHATLLLSDGVPILEVQHRLGHANASVTLNRYGHILIDNKDKILNAVDNLLGNVVI